MSSLAFLDRRVRPDLPAWAMSQRAPAEQIAKPSTPSFDDMAAGWGQRLRLVRKVVAPSARALAQACNISPQRWSHWEKERHPPEFRAMLLLKHWHGVSLDWIYAADIDGLPGHLIRRMLAVADHPDIDQAKALLRSKLMTGATGDKPTTLHERPSGL